MEFNNQVAIVTGGTRGIGAGITHAFLKQGARVVATYARNDQTAMAFKDSLGDQGEFLTLKKFDVSNFEECQASFNDITEQFEQIHILINNSGIRKDNLTATMSQSDWDDVLNINLKGTFNMCQLATLHMMKKRYGRIINISSVAGHMGIPGQANYSASKAGQIALSKSLSKEVAKRKITVNNICPGFIETELIADLEAELVKSYKAQVPLKRFGTVEEVAHSVLFLASEKASYITGTSIDISGGL